MATQQSVNRRRGKAAETRTAAVTGGTKVPFSGAGAVKGDVHAGPVFYEIKSTAVRNGAGVKSYRLEKDVLLKMQAQQAREKKPLGALVVHFHGDRNDWVCIGWDQWQTLLNLYEEWLGDPDIDPTAPSPLLRKDLYYAELAKRNGG